jgi:hypothetical protein
MAAEDNVASRPAPEATHGKPVLPCVVREMSKGNQRFAGTLRQRRTYRATVAVVPGGSCRMMICEAGMDGAIE